MDRLTYKIGNKTYLKGGLDGKWETMDRYDLIENAVEKLGLYEDQEEFFELSADQVKSIMTERDEYKLKFYQMCHSIAILRIELLGGDYTATDTDTIVKDIVEKYALDKKKPKKWSWFKRVREKEIKKDV